MKFLSELKNKNLSNRICLLRVDFNINDADLRGLRPPKVTSSAEGGLKRGFTRNNIHPRILAVLPTIKFLIKRGAKVVILSHRGRPPKVSSSKFQVSSYTLRPFARILSKLLKKPVCFIDFRKGFNISKIRKITTITRDSIFLLENLRFLPAEDKNDKKLAKQLASLATFYVNDAFSVSHRKNASVVAITKFLPSYAGLLLEKEIKNLSRIMKNPKKPLVIILGGVKVSDKIGVIKNFLKEVKGHCCEATPRRVKSKVNCFLTGGGVANTFLAAQGLPIGDSLYDKTADVRGLLRRYSRKIILPIDLVTENGKILDIGPETAKKYAEIIKNARTIIWNGPMGYIEDKRFTKGTKAIIKAIMKSRAFSVIGGGETTSLMSKVKSQKFL